MKKLASHIHSIPLLLLLASWAVCGCAPKNGAGTASADIHYHMMEVPEGIADKFIPGDSRVKLEQSDYSIGILKNQNISELIQRIDKKPGVLAADKRSISWWPQEADTFAFSIADGELLGGSVGAMYFGVRNVKSAKEVRIAGNITHTINTQKALQSNFLYEGVVPDNDMVVFIAPFERKDGTRLNHVMIFEVKNWQGD